MNFNIENSRQQMRKGVIELCVLAIIAEKEIYPPEILEKLKSAGLNVVEGTLYPLLMRLKNSGLLNYEWVESKSGPPRKYYRLTKAGEEFLKELQASWEELYITVSKTTNKLN
jgi:PadR family transcriptional regulator, regulatory protein PadR